jgi:hypothetical protein
MVLLWESAAIGSWRAVGRYQVLPRLVLVIP